LSNFIVEVKIITKVDSVDAGSCAADSDSFADEILATALQFFGIGDKLMVKHRNSYFSKY